MVWLKKILDFFGASKLAQWVLKKIFRFAVKKGLKLVWKAIDDKAMPMLKEEMFDLGVGFSTKGNKLVNKGKFTKGEWERIETRIETLSEKFWDGANKDD